MEELLLKENSWTIASPRIFQVLSKVKTVLISGCGGGYDVTSGLPLYFALRAQGKQVYLANLSFTDLQRKVTTKDQYYCKGCVKVTHDMKIKDAVDTYFPEFYLSIWFWEKFNEDVPIFTFSRSTGVVQLTEVYSKICSSHKVEAIVLVDGGTDSLMFGTEEALGTPVEDQTSILAASSLPDVPIKLLTAIGFGVDTFHGVSHGLFLENVATLEREGGYLGCFSVPRQSLEGGLYLEGYQAIAKHMQPSIVCASITDAMKGHFGNHHSTSRTGNSELFINPLMPVYWTFELEKLVRYIPYAAPLKKTSTSQDVMRVIYGHHNTLKKEDKLRKPISLPM